MTTMKIPADATFFPVAPVYPEYLEQAIEGHKRAIATQNSQRADTFQKACDGWAATAARDRDVGNVLKPKPVALPQIAVHTVDVACQAVPEEGASTITVVLAAPEDRRGAYMWDEEQVPAVCPDLAPAAIAVKPQPDPEKFVMLGQNDEIPVGMVVTAPDGSTWQKHHAMTPFGVVNWLVRLG